MVTSGRQRFTLKEWSWILYDWANSVYATNIMAAIFPTIFVSFAGSAGDHQWAFGTSAATLAVALLAPFLGALADYKGMKKKLFVVFLSLGVVFTALIALTADWRVMLVCYVLSRIGFSGSCLFYDSFLTDVTTRDRMDKVSSWGYAMGYIGGSTIPFVMSIAMLLFLGYSSPVAQKFSILITSVWWLAFSIPFLRNVRQEYHIDAAERPSLRQVTLNILRTAREIAARRGLLLFIIAYFFYIDGVGTVISISTAYGASLGLGSVGMILALLVTQIVAMPCSILFARVARRISTRRALLIAISVYMFICSVGFVMGFTLEPHQDGFEQAFLPFSQRLRAEAEGLRGAESAEGFDPALDDYLAQAKRAVLNGDEAAMSALAFDPGAGGMDGGAQPASDRLRGMVIAFASDSSPLVDAYNHAIRRSTVLFWAMAILVGTVQGGIQAVSRSYYGKLVPRERSNEFFGFFDIFGKFASVIGPFLYAVVGNLTGRSSLGTLCLLALFLTGFIILLRAGRPLAELEKEQAGA